jgi:hypothetical protein
MESGKNKQLCALLSSLNISPFNICRMLNSIYKMLNQCRLVKGVERIPTPVVSRGGCPHPPLEVC